MKPNLETLRKTPPPAVFAPSKDHQRSAAEAQLQVERGLTWPHRPCGKWPFPMWDSNPPTPTHGSVSSSLFDVFFSHFVNRGKAALRETTYPKNSCNSPALLAQSSPGDTRETPKIHGFITILCITALPSLGGILQFQIHSNPLSASMILVKSLYFQW